MTSRSAVLLIGLLVTAAAIAPLGTGCESPQQSKKEVRAQSTRLVVTRVHDEKGRIANPVPREIVEPAALSDFCDAMHEWENRWKPLRHGERVALASNYQVESTCSDGRKYQFAGYIPEDKDQSSSLVGDRGTLELNADQVHRLKRILDIGTKVN